MEEAVAAVVTGAVTVASKDAQLNGLAIRKGNYLGLADGEPVAQGESFDEVAAAMFEALLVEPRAYVTVLKGVGRAGRDGTRRRARKSGIRDSSSRCTRAGSRTTRYWFRPSIALLQYSRVVAADERIRIVIIEDNAVFREALELLLGLRSDLARRRVRRRRRGGGAGVPRAQPARRADGLPPARASTASRRRAR